MLQLCYEINYQQVFLCVRRYTRNSIGKKTSKNLKEEDIIKQGMNLSEDSSGTNAVALSIKLKKPIYTNSDQNYCKFLKKYNFYCTPLWIYKEIIGYLAIITTERMSTELIAITDLMAYKVANEYKLGLKDNLTPGSNNVSLSDKQRNILRLIARGMTDKAISVETGLCFATIQYHKRNIFKKLGACSSTEATIKALKLNLIFLDEIKIQ